MPRTVALPDGSEVEFPDTMSDADVSSAVQGLVGARPSDEHTVGGALLNVAKVPGQMIGAAAGLARQAGGAVLRGYSKLLDDPGKAISETVAGAATLPQRAMDLAKAAPAAIGEHLNRYNPTSHDGTSNLRETLYHDPGGVMMDASMAGRGLGMIPGLRKIGAIGEAVDPMLNTAKIASAVGKPVGRMLQNKAEGAMTSALKVTDTLRRRNPDVNIPRVALERGIPVSGAGIERNAKAIGGIEDRIGEAVDQSPAKIQLSLRKMPEMRGEFRRAVSRPMRAADPSMAANARSRVGNFFDPISDPKMVTVQRSVTSPIVGPSGQPITTQVPTQVQRGTVPRDLSARDVQDMKVRLGKMLSSTFGKDNVTLPSVEMNQAIRSDLRNVVAQAVPEVGPLNAELGPRYAVQDALEHRVPMFERQNQLSMRAGLGAGVLGGFGALPGRLAGALIGAAVDNPEVLSRAAIAMNQSAQRIQRLTKTAEKLAPFATGATFAKNIAQMAPSHGAARERGQITTSAVDELTQTNAFRRLPVEQQDQEIQQLVSDVALLTGGVADITKLKARSPSIIKGLMATRTTERP